MSNITVQGGNLDVRYTLTMRGFPFHPGQIVEVAGTNVDGVFAVDDVVHDAVILRKLNRRELVEYAVRVLLDYIVAFGIRIWRKIRG